MEGTEVLAGPDATDLVAGNVYDIADMLLQGDTIDGDQTTTDSSHCNSVTDVPGMNSMNQLMADGSSGGSLQDRSNSAAAVGDTPWVNPLANIQAYSVEPQALLQEMLEEGAYYNGNDEMYYGQRQLTEMQPVPPESGGVRIVSVSPTPIASLDQRASSSNEKESTESGKDSEGGNHEVGDLISMITSESSAAKEQTSAGSELLQAGSIKSEPMDNSYFMQNMSEQYQGQSPSSSAENSEDDTEDEETGKPQYNIVSLDPTSFPDSKVKAMQQVARTHHHDSKAERKVGRRSQSKHKAKPRKLLEDPEPTSSKEKGGEPPIKRQRRDELKMTINLNLINSAKASYNTRQGAVVKKRGRGRPRTKPPYVPTGRPRGRPPKSGRPAQIRAPVAVPKVKIEPLDEGYGDQEEQVTEEPDLDTSETYIPRVHGLRSRRRMNTKSVKGTHIMIYKEYRCFECNDDKMYVDKDAFLEHWKGTHFVVEEDGANLYCTQCGAKYSVYLQRFHRATDVLQYIAFYFNHKVKRHSMEAPSYIEEMKCPEPTCYYKAYTSYGLSRHIEEGKHRSRPPRSYSLLGQDGPVANVPGSENYVRGKGNKYSLIFKEFKCFVCADGKEFTDISTMLDHWRDSHFQFSDTEAIIPCGFCDAMYKVPRCRFHRQTDTMQYIAYFFSHLVKRHNIEVPPYIEQLRCNQPGCKFVTYTKQLLQRHLQEVKHITLSRTPALEGGELSQSPGLRSPYLSFKAYRCFMCIDDQGQHCGPFENGATFAEHWRQSHFTLEHNKVFLRCPYCPMLYQVQTSRFPRNADVLAVIARFFTHTVKKHNLEPPDYIEQLHCSVPGCEFRCFTPQILDGHRMTKRDPAHMGVLVDMYGSANMPTLSLRYNNRNQNIGQATVNPEKAMANLEGIQNHVDQSTSEQPASADGVNSTKEVAQADLPLVNHSNGATDPTWNSNIEALSKQIAEGVLKSLTVPDATTSLDAPDTIETSELDSTLDSSLNQTGGSSTNLEDSIDTSDMKAKSLLCFTDAIRCFECSDDQVFKDHADFVGHWRHKHFTIGNFEVYITCRLCNMRIGLNKPLWHRDHDIGRCIASYLTHSMKKHGTECPSFIKELECPEPGCGYKTLTVKHLQFHVRHTKHHKLEKAKKVAAGLDPGMDSREVIRRSSTFRVNDNGLTFKEYQCYLCADGVFYKTCLDYETHWRTTHVMNHEDKDCLMCHICGTTFISHLYPSIAFLFCHLVKRHDFEVPWYIEEYTCEEQHCNYVTYTKALLMKHKQGQRHASGSGVFQYYLNFQEYRCFLCPTPSTVYPSKKVFESHLMSSHVEKCGDGGDYFRCPDCNHHFTLHHCKKPELNYDKPDPSRTLCVLFNHIVVKHNLEIPPYILSFKCPRDDCNFVTVRKYTLDRHVASHTADQQCYQCGMFFSKTRIEKHFKRCLSGKPCGVRTSSGPRTFVCPDCGMSLVQRKALKAHMHEAHGKNIEDCDELPKGYNVKYKKLKASETGLAYKCDQCGKILLEKKSMKRHMLSVHMKEVEPSELYAVQHEPPKVDEGPKHYECMLCGVQMNLMKSVKRHMMKQHSMKVGARDLESCYVRVDPEAPKRPYAGLAQKRKERAIERKEQEYIITPHATLTTIDESEISDFTSSQRAYTASSPEAPVLPNPEPTLIEMTTVPQLHSIRTDVEPLKLPQQSIFPTPKPIPSTTITSAASVVANQALDFSMRLNDLEAGEIPSGSHRIELLNQRLVHPSHPTSTLSEPHSTAILNNPSVITSSRHLHNGQPPPPHPPPPLTAPPSTQMTLTSADRLELFTQRIGHPQAMNMGIMPGTIHPRDVNIVPMDFRMGVGVGNLQTAT